MDTDKMSAGHLLVDQIFVYKITEDKIFEDKMTAD